LRCVSLRFSNIYGPHSAHKKSVVAAFIKRALNNEPLIVYSDGTQQRDYLYVGDLVRGIAAAIDRGATGTFQLGSGRPTSLRILIQALETICGRRLEVRYEPRRAAEIHSTWCDISKARTKFAYTAPTTLADGLRRTWDWFAANPSATARQKVLTTAD
jgi:UDP-glucose 4-epimerase